MNVEDLRAAMFKTRLDGSADSLRSIGSVEAELDTNDDSLPHKIVSDGRLAPVNLYRELELERNKKVWNQKEKKRKRDSITPDELAKSLKNTGDSGSDEELLDISKKSNTNLDTKKRRKVKVKKGGKRTRKKLGKRRKKRTRKKRTRKKRGGARKKKNGFLNWFFQRDSDTNNMNLVVSNKPKRKSIYGEPHPLRKFIVDPRDNDDFDEDRTDGFSISFPFWGGRRKKRKKKTKKRRRKKR